MGQIVELHKKGKLAEGFGREGAPANADGARPQAAAGGGADTPPSNTVSANCNSGKPIFLALRRGVDSLYLSYAGRLFVRRAEELAELKGAARSQAPSDVAKAQLRLGEHTFEVRDKGAGLFPYVLEDNAYRIALASLDARSLPMAYVKVSSHRLASDTPQAVAAELLGLLAELGGVEGAARVSRIDLFVDFVSDVDMEAWGRRAWVTRARSVNAYAVDDRFSGWAIGLGGPMAARLYDKTLELAKSGKDWLRPLWTARGWDGEARVLRLEFEIKRDTLKGFELAELGRVLSALPGLWSYCTTEWLRLTIPSAEDATRSRWPVHPLWQLLSSVDWDGDPAPLSRTFKADRAPSVAWIVRQVFALLCSLMAVRGLYDYAPGVEQLQRELDAYLGERSEREWVEPSRIVREQVALKVRRFNTGFNLDEIPDGDRLAEEHDELLQRAREYREASQGS